MKRLMSAVVMVAFVTALAGLPMVAQAQTTPPAPTPATPATPPAQKPADKPAEKPARAAGQTKAAPATAEKKPAAKNASGTVKSASADSITIAGKDKGKDAEWTFAVEPDTKVKKGDKDASPADLKAGDSVQVRYTEKDGKMVAQAVTVRAAKSAVAPKKS